MVVAIILLIIVLVFLGWILFMPLVVDVDTGRSVYQIYQRGTIRFWLSPGFQPHLHLLGISIPLKSSKSATKAKHQARSKSRSAMHFSNIQTLVKRILRSINIKWFKLDLDTDDVVVNALMIPVFTSVSRGPVQLTTNFGGRVYASLRAEVTLYSVAWAFLLFFTKK